MRIAPNPSSTLLPRSTPDAALASAAIRTQGSTGGPARPPMARVFEGELVPRPIVATQLADQARPTPPTAVYTTLSAPAATSPKALFYLLHSSEDSLRANPIGVNVDVLA